MGKGPLALVSAIILISFALLPIIRSQAPIPESLTLTVYADGYVSVEYNLQVDPQSPTANLTVFGQVLIDVVALDGQGLPLDYTALNGNVTIHTLGVEEVRLTYFTQELTRKEGRFWVLNLTAPIKATLILPSKATIVDFNEIPDLMESNDDQVLLIMPAGSIEVTYVTSVVGTREYAQIVINEAEKTINEIKALNLIITEAEAILQESKEDFNRGDYIKSETNGKKAKSVALQINGTATQANLSMNLAKSEIDKAKQEGRTNGLSEAESLSEQADDAYTTGNYTQALTLATQSQSKALASTTPFPMLEVLGALTIAGTIIGVMALTRRKKETPKPVKTKKPIDVERIIKGQDLHPEEIDAIRLIAESNGEMFEADLYSRLNLPRTTTWRLVRRLEGMGIVEIRKMRRSNMIRLKK